MTAYHIIMICLVGVGTPLGSIAIYLLKRIDLRLDRIDKRVDNNITRAEYESDKRLFWKSKNINMG